MQIPQNFSHLIIFIGLVLMYYGGSQIIPISDSRVNMLQNYMFEKDSLDNLTDSLKFAIEVHEIEAANSEDKVLSIKEKYKLEMRKFNIQKRIIYNDTNYENKLLHIELKKSLYTIIIIGGFVVFYLGLTSLIRIEAHKNELLKSELVSKKKYYTKCQSCGRKFSSMVIYGTEKNAEINSAFCKDCYELGEFTNPDLTMEQVFNERIKYLNKPCLKIKKFMARVHFSILDRWNKDQY